MSAPIPASTSGDELDETFAAAAAARRPWARCSATRRAAVLRAVASALDAAAGTLVPIAQDETHLPALRLTSELTRTTFQLRLHADEIETGRPFDARIDHADPTWGTGPRPDLRRMQVPLGPVVVFAASNFPFAFSIAGGDTSSALAAGCPVIVKAHPGHRRLSDATADIVVRALRATDAAPGLFAIIHGDDAGRSAVLDPRIAAGVSPVLSLGIQCRSANSQALRHRRVIQRLTTRRVRSPGRCGCPWCMECEYRSLGRRRQRRGLPVVSRSAARPQARRRSTETPTRPLVVFECLGYAGRL